MITTVYDHIIRPQRSAFSILKRVLAADLNSACRMATDGLALWRPVWLTSRNVFNRKTIWPRRNTDSARVDNPNTMSGSAQTVSEKFLALTSVSVSHLVMSTHSNVWRFRNWLLSAHIWAFVIFKTHVLLSVGSECSLGSKDTRSGGISFCFWNRPHPPTEVIWKMKQLSRWVFNWV